MFVAGVVENHVEDDSNIEFPSRSHEMLEVVHRPEVGVDAAVVADVVPVIRIRRIETGVDPNRANAKVLQILQPRDHALKVTDAISVRILERARIDLVEDAGFPPRRSRFVSGCPYQGKKAISAGCAFFALLAVDRPTSGLSRA